MTVGRIYHNTLLGVDTICINDSGKDDPLFCRYELKRIGYESWNVSLWANKNTLNRWIDVSDKYSIEQKYEQLTLWEEQDESYN